MITRDIMNEEMTKMVRNNPAGVGAKSVWHGCEKISRHSTCFALCLDPLQGRPHQYRV